MLRTPLLALPLCLTTLLLAAPPAGAQTELARFVGQAGDLMGVGLGGYDLDGDLWDDLVVAAPFDDGGFTDGGVVRAYSGKTGALIWERHGSSIGARLGTSMAWYGDYNGDVVVDLIVGEPYAKHFSGPAPGRVTLLDGATGVTLNSVWGDDDGEAFGWSVAGNIDWNGNSARDIAVGAPYDDDAGVNAGSFTVIDGQTWTTLAAFHGLQGDYLGFCVSTVRNVDDFGLFDLAVGSPYADLQLGQITITNCGKVQVYASNGKGLVQTYYGLFSSGYFGWSICGLDDLDGDGRDDFVVGEPGYDGPAGADTGRLRILSGVTNATLDVLVGDAAGDKLGSSLAWLPDVDGDGRYDFAAGAPQSSSGIGYARVYSGLDRDVLLTLHGEAPADRFGTLVANAGDLNEDGLHDLAVGAPLLDQPPGSNNGVVRVHSIGCPGTVNYCTAGTSASGCQAQIAGAGTPSASSLGGFSLIVTGAEGNKPGLFFFGTNGRQANPWGNGTSYQCVVPPVKRTELLAGGGTNGACDGVFSKDMNLHWQLKPAQNPGAGEVVQAQLWYRDPLNTSNQTTSLSNAVEFAVCP